MHAIASGVDGFLYPAFRDGDVILTGEKGLVGGHLADHGFGLLLGLTRRIAAAVRATAPTAGATGRSCAARRSSSRA